MIVAINHLVQYDQTLQPTSLQPNSNAGGGGERVLWTAIHWAIKNDLKRSDLKGNATKGDGVEEGKKGLVCVVYSGDYPSVGKEEILDRVFVSRSGWPWCRGSERGTGAAGEVRR